MPHSVWLDEISVQYELGLGPKNQLRISVPSAVWDQAQSRLDSWQDPNFSQQAHPESGGFRAPRPAPWGRGQVFMPTVRARGGFVIWEYVLPILKQTGSATPYHQGMNISASLGQLFRSLSYIDVPAGSPHQLLQITGLSLEGGLGGCALGGFIGQHLGRWLAARGNDEEMTANIVRTMERTWARLNGRRIPSSLREFRFRIFENGTLWLHCPGDACEVACGDLMWDKNRGRGYALNVHNMDSPMQQLTFIWALAKVCQLARENGLQ